MVNNFLDLSSTFRQLECHINSNTNISSNNSGIVKADWYRGINNKKVLVMNSMEISILQTVSITTVLFVSKLRFSSTPISVLGNYICVAWIGEQSVRNKTSNTAQVIMKRKA